ncbi:branched-chain amino acid transport system II carrier protein [Xenorhabdus thuongxuanensis]|uniref:Branched-chain amino acid transport system carrier protein n=1 Tax=Xenorhabdus thuongxuanensis TaxID=1873484 RepID=A0A1Q5TS77_9GAMM|nr:branched-chain amino acid transport system II carrier protein [Xenorhabdus thuongxuanensis]
MTYRLLSKDIRALGFMAFVLLVVAGNIIFSPMVDLQAGEHIWSTTVGFLLTAMSPGTCADMISIRRLA